MIQVVTLTKAGGPLTKHVSLNPDGTLKADGSACKMSAGSACRSTFATLQNFADHIAGLGSDQAIALGRLLPTLPDQVTITVKAKLNGQADQVARTAAFINYSAGEPAPLLCDFDTKYMPSEVHDRVARAGGFAKALAEVLPVIENGIGLIHRRSTSAGLSRSDTGAQMPGSAGQHLYIHIADGADAVRALRALHDRCWLAGFGWYAVGRAGQLLDRSLVDRMVGGPERLVFEGPPILAPPLVQDPAQRRPQVRDGVPLDTRAAIPSLDPGEKVKIEQLKNAAAHALAGECAKVRAAYVAARIEELVKAGATPETAKATVGQLCGGVLLPTVELEFDDAALAGNTVRDVLADPEMYIGETLADPIEGIEYGVCKAKVLRRADGAIVIHSFAHGHSFYVCKHDPESLRAALAKIADDDVITMFVRLRRLAELGDVEGPRIRQELIARLKIGKREFNKQEAAAQNELEREDRERRKRERQVKGDNKPTVRVVEGEADRMADEIETILIAARVELYQRGTALCYPTHMPLPTADGGTTMSVALYGIDVAGLIDRFCRYAHWIKWSDKQKDFVAADPPPQVAAILRTRVGHWHFPVVRGIIATPTLRADGSLLATPGYDPASKLYLYLDPGFTMPEIPDEPTRDDALQRLAKLDALLDEVPFVDAASRSVALALIITAVIRGAIAVAPIHAATAPAAGTGKSFLFDIAAAIAIGDRCPVIFAGKNWEETEKKINGLLLDGIPLFSIDNMVTPLGGDLMCQASERPLLTLRRLGKSDPIRTLNAALIGANGNNLVVEGDLTRRVVMATLDAKLERPELRAFTANPCKTVLGNRGDYVAAVLTIVRAYLTNPFAADPYPLASYEEWTHMVRGPLVWLGRADPADSMIALREADPVVNELVNVMDTWEAAVGIGNGLTIAEVVHNIDRPPMPSAQGYPDLDAFNTACNQARQDWETLGSVFATVCNTRTTPDGRAIGTWLRGMRDRIATGRTFTAKPAHKGVNRWWLAKVTTSG
jgi:putative DNA primase/helicase